MSESGVSSEWKYLSSPTGGTVLTKASCKTAYYRKTAKAWLMPWEVVFRMHHELRFCWSGARIVSANAICYSSLVNAAIQADSCGTPQGISFATAYDQRGGWHSIAQNTYRNCLPYVGGWTCWRQVTPTLHIYARAGGTWSGSGGDGSGG